MINIDQYLFYKVGVWTFGISAIMNTVTLFQIFPILMFSEAISRIASCIFGYALFGFFLYLYRQLPPKNIKEYSEKEFQELLKKN